MEPEKFYTLIYQYENSTNDLLDSFELHDALVHSQQAQLCLAKWIEYSLLCKEPSFSMSEETTDKVFKQIIKRARQLDIRSRSSLLGLNWIKGTVRLQSVKLLKLYSLYDPFQLFATNSILKPCRNQVYVPPHRHLSNSSL